MDTLCLIRYRTLHRREISIFHEFEQILNLSATVARKPTCILIVVITLQERISEWCSDMCDLSVGDHSFALDPQEWMELWAVARTVERLATRLTCRYAWKTSQNRGWSIIVDENFLHKYLVRYRHTGLSKRVRISVISILGIFVCEIIWL